MNYTLKGNLRAQVCKKETLVEFAKNIITCLSVFALGACTDATTPNVIFIADACNVDAPAHEQVVQRGKTFQIEGWAYDRRDATVPEHIIVQLISEDQKKVISLPASRGVKRPDVAASHKNPSLENAGFKATVSPDKVSAGRYRVSVLQKTPNQLLLCGGGFIFTLK